MMRKLVENPVIGKPSLKYAYDFAKRKHDDTGAIRKNTEQPYFVHPEMVADIVAVYDGTTTEIEAALLHDTLEDTDTTSEELEAVYGPAVAQIVEEVTNFQPEVDRLGKEEYIKQELLELSPSALLVKAADCLANSLDHPKPGQAERIARSFAYMLEFRDDIPDNVRRLIKSLPLMADYDLDKPEFEDDLNDYEDDLINYPYYLADSRNLPSDKERLQEGKKLKTLAMSCLMALAGMNVLNARALKDKDDWNKSAKEVKKELIAEYGKDGKIPKEDLRKMFKACAKSYKEDGEWFFAEEDGQTVTANLLAQLGFKQAAEDVEKINIEFEKYWDKYGIHENRKHRMCQSV